MPIVFPEGLMVSVSGFRGRVGDPLTPELVAGLGAAFGAFLRAEGAGEVVCVGRDSRTSGPMFFDAVTSGLRSVGMSIIDVGIVPTPTVLLAVEYHHAAGGVAVTASHNPAEWNALKLATGEGMFLDGERSARFRRFVEEQDPPRSRWDGLGTVEVDGGAIDRHIDRILALPQIDVEAIRERRFHVALDCVHGAGGAIVPKLLDALGCSVVAIGTETDGRFPRNPEPTADNLVDLAELVRSNRSEVGFAVDPDVDRLSLVDESGVPLGEDYTLALASAVVLERNPGRVVTNLSTSQVVGDVARSYGGELVLAPVGEINVARRMQSESAVVGGEGNGGVILPDIHHTRDAPVAVALILQHILDTGTSLGDAARRLPAYSIVKEKVSFPREALDEAYSALANDLDAAQEDRADGLRLAWPDSSSWLHVRPSGTEPIVRLIAEAPTQEAARSLVERAGDVLHGVA